MECLEKIIGLSKTTCECLTDSLPQGSDEINVNESDSDVFLDELEGFNMNTLDSASDCSQGSVWDIMNTARKNAIQDLKTSLLACIGSSYKPRIKNLTAQIGESAFKGDVTSISSTYSGLRISTFQIKGGYVVIKKIGVLINQSANVKVKIFSNENDGTLIYESGLFAVTANTLSWGVLTVPEELPMWSTNEMQPRYYIVVELPSGAKPKQNKIDCGCGKPKPFKQWSDVVGVYGDDENDVDSFKVSSNYANGIVVDAEFKCKASDVICNSEYPLDYENDPNAMHMAYAVRFRAGARAYDVLINSTEINRLTMMNRDQMKENRDRWNTEFNTYMTYLCQNISVDSNDCFVCKTNDRSITKATILK